MGWFIWFVVAFGVIHLITAICCFIFGGGSFSNYDHYLLSGLVGIVAGQMIGR